MNNRRAVEIAIAAIEARGRITITDGVASPKAFRTPAIQRAAAEDAQAWAMLQHLGTII